MADPEHEELARGGSRLIALWREANPLALLCLSSAYLDGANLGGADLRHADLSNANLSGANLNNANLSGAKLSHADLSGASLSHADLNLADLILVNLVRANLIRASLSSTNLYHANLSNANFSNADLSNANLNSANLRNANLSSANLSDANLTDAALTGANLTRADLTDACLTHTSLADAYFFHTALDGANFSEAWIYRTFFGSGLSNAIGLDETDHGGSSEISQATLLNLPDPLPLNFLRGCGLPDQLIEFARAQQSAIRFYSCFISHSHKDAEFARRIHEALQCAGVRCWYAPEDLKTGDRLLPTIGEAIRVSEKLVLILSEESINSEWVYSEVGRALKQEEERGKDVLFPIRVDDAVFEVEFGWAKRLVKPETGRLIGDFREWKNHDAFQVAFERLLRDLRANDRA